MRRQICSRIVFPRVYVCWRRIAVHNERGHHTGLDVTDHGRTTGTGQPDPADSRRELVVRVGDRLGLDPGVDPVRHDGRPVGPEAQLANYRAPGVGHVGGHTVRRHVPGAVGRAFRAGPVGRGRVHGAARVRR